MKAICRVAKMKGAGSIGGKSDHNYRHAHVPNADATREHLNQEYVNKHTQLGPAIEERLQLASINKMRQDAVKGMEFILTASPEVFKRDETGQVVDDYRKSKWVEANLDFMRRQYGSNLVAFTLHQDEKTPHIHAVIVPITNDGRLCAKELFNPKTLRQLQTDYAQAMKPFGLERGTEGSRARHVEMKHIYGLQQAQRQEIQRESTPAQQQEPLQISKPGVLDLLDLERWRQQEETRINAEYNRRLAEVQQTARFAQDAAIANATAKEQGKVLQQRLATAESLKQANHEKAQKATRQLTETTQMIEKVALLTDEKRLNPEWSQQTAKKVRERVIPQLERDLVQSVQSITTSDVSQANQQLRQGMEQRGYEFASDNGNKTSLLIEPKSGIQINMATGQFEGKSIGELVSRRTEQVRQEELKHKPRQSRGLGM